MGFKNKDQWKGKGGLMGFFDSIYKILKNKSIDKKNNFIGNEQINLNKLANVRKGLVHEYTEKDILVSIKNLAMQDIKDKYKICVWVSKKVIQSARNFMMLIYGLIFSF